MLNLGEVDNRLRHNPYRKIENDIQLEKFLDDFKKIFQNFKTNIDNFIPIEMPDEYSILNFCLGEIKLELDL